MQLLDQEVQTLADVATLFEQALDFVEVRAQARDFFSHVDADGKGRGFGQGAVLGGFGCNRAFAEGHGLLPALQELLALLLHQLRHQRRGGLGQFAQLLDAVEQHVGQALALTGASREQLGDGLFGQGRSDFAPVRGGGGGAAAQAQHIGHGKVACLGQPGLNRVLQGHQALQLGG